MRQSIQRALTESIALYAIVLTLGSIVAAAVLSPVVNWLVN